MFDGSYFSSPIRERAFCIAIAIVFNYSISSLDAFSFPSALSTCISGDDIDDTGDDDEIEKRFLIVDNPAMPSGTGMEVES